MPGQNDVSTTLRFETDAAEAKVIRMNQLLSEMQGRAANINIGVNTAGAERALAGGGVAGSASVGGRGSAGGAAGAAHQSVVSTPSGGVAGVYYDSKIQRFRDADRQNRVMKLSDAAQKLMVEGIMTSTGSFNDMGGSPAAPSLVPVAASAIPSSGGGGRQLGGFNPIFPPPPPVDPTVMMAAPGPNGPWGQGGPNGMAQWQPTVQMSSAQIARAQAMGMPFANWGTGPMSGLWSGVQGMWSGNRTVQSLGRGLAVAAGVSVSDYMNVATQEALTGHKDYMGSMRAGGQAIGGIIGAFAGLPFGFWGSGIAAGAGANIGGSVASWLAAPMMRAEQINQSFFGMQSVLGTPSASELRNWADGSGGAGLAGYINTTVWPSPTRAFSPQAVGSIWSSVAGGMLAGGIRPNAPGTPFDYSGAVAPAPPSLGPMQRETSSVRAAALLGGAGAAFYAGYKGLPLGKEPNEWHQQWGAYGQQMRQYGETVRGSGQSETLAQTISRRIALMFPEEKSAQEVANRVAPIYGTLPETGDNALDILTRYGPTDTFRYMSVQKEPRRSKVWRAGRFNEPMNAWREEFTPDTDFSVEQLSEYSAGIRGLQRKAKMGSLRIRGAGFETAVATGAEMGYIEGLPGGLGGRDSMAYAEARQRYRGAVNQMFSEQDATSFGVPDVQLSGVEARLNMMPFAPGNRMAVGLTHASLRSRHIGRLSSRMEYMRGKGLLSEEDEYNYTSQIEGLRTANAQVVAMISDGMSDQLPALSAGGVASYNRFNSLNLAAMRLGMTGHPARNFGAASGRQANMQSAFLNAFDTRPMPPVGTTQAMNNSPAETNAILRRTNQLLEMILNGTYGRGGRPSGSGGLAPGGSGSQAGAGASG